MCAQTALDSISQSEAEWIRERDYWDAVMTERTIREEAEIRGLKSGMEKGLEQGKYQKAVECARSLYANGVSVELIAKSLNMTNEQIKEIVRDVEVIA